MKNILSILFRRKREAVLFAICMVLFPLGISYVLTEKYESAATVLLTAGRFKKPFLPTEKDSQTGFIQVSMEDVASEVELLMSRPVLEKVVKENELYIFPEPAEDEYLKRFAAVLKKGLNGLLVMLNLKKEMTDFEVAVEKLENDIDVEFLKRTNIITIEWQGYSPTQAQNVVESIVREYIKHHIEVHGYASAFKVIEDEMKVSQQRVLAVEGKINRLKTDFGSYDLDKEREIVLEKYLAAKSTYENLLNVDANSVTSTSRGLYSDDPNFVGLMQDLTKIEMERIANISSYGANNKRVATNDQQIANLKALIKSQHKHNVAAWSKSASRYGDRLNKLEKVREQMAALSRELAGALDAYQIGRQKYNEALIGGAMDRADVASVRVVAPASYNSTPAFPRKILLLVISLFFAVIGGIAAAFSAEKMYSRIVQIGDVSLFAKLAVLFTIPRFSLRELQNERWLTNSLSKKMAAIRHLLADTSETSKVHLVISPAPGAGTSFVTEQLARYAQRSTKAKSLYLDVGYGREEGTRTSVEMAAADMSAYIKCSDAADSLMVWVSPDELSLDNASFGMLLERLKIQGYGNIFIDLPNERDDASYLNVIPCCDHLFVNVAYDITDKHALRRFVSVIEEQSVKTPDGAFFNLRQNPIPEYIYKRL